MDNDPSIYTVSSWNDNGGGFIQNKHLTDVDHSPPYRRGQAFNLNVCHAPILVECLFPMALLNGQKHHVADEKRLYRSDFFPGLGWMLNKKLWKELEPLWPDSYWHGLMDSACHVIGQV